jgi:N-formylglutamate deformylase
MAGHSRPEGNQGRFDPVLSALHAHPFKIHRPEAQRVPFVFASPHSGRLYPASFVAQSRLDPLSLRRSEDAYVDALFGGALALGAPMLAARFPRAYLDVNRAASELDPTMFDGMLSVRVEGPNARVNAGLGVIPRVVRDGAEIYANKLPPADARERIARLHEPYHAALSRLIDETVQRFGVAVLIDCHSMPSAASVPDVVLGDRFGASATPLVMRLAEQSFEGSGFRVTRNAPYAGGYTTHLYGRRDAGVHALQIEINRSLYLNEYSIVPGGNFESLKARLTKALESLVTIDLEELRPGNTQLAAY